MLAVLKQKELPETKTDKPVSGLLYFPMEKQKAKDLELRYNPLRRQDHHALPPEKK